LISLRLQNALAFRDFSPRPVWENCPYARQILLFPRPADHTPLFSLQSEWKHWIAKELIEKPIPQKPKKCKIRFYMATAHWPWVNPNSSGSGIIFSNNPSSVITLMGYGTASNIA